MTSSWQLDTFAHILGTIVHRTVACTPTVHWVFVGPVTFAPTCLLVPRGNRWSWPYCWFHCEVTMAEIWWTIADLAVVIAPSVLAGAALPGTDGLTSHVGMGRVLGHSSGGFGERGGCGTHRGPRPQSCRGSGFPSGPVCHWGCRGGSWTWCRSSCRSSCRSNCSWKCSCSRWWSHCRRRNSGLSDGHIRASIELFLSTQTHALATCRRLHTPAIACKVVHLEVNKQYGPGAWLA